MYKHQALGGSAQVAWGPPRTVTWPLSAAPAGPCMHQFIPLHRLQRCCGGDKIAGQEPAHRSALCMQRLSVTGCLHVVHAALLLPPLCNNRPLPPSLRPPLPCASTPAPARAPLVLPAGNLDLLKVSLPVKMFEPRSYLQKLADPWVHTRFLGAAAAATNPVERLQAVVTFFIAGAAGGGAGSAGSQAGILRRHDRKGEPLSLSARYGSRPRPGWPSGLPILPPSFPPSPAPSPFKAFTTPFRAGPSPSTPFWGRRGRRASPTAAPSSWNRSRTTPPSPPSSCWAPAPSSPSRARGARRGWGRAGGPPLHDLAGCSSPLSAPPRPPRPFPLASLHS